MPSPVKFCTVTSVSALPPSAAGPIASPGPETPAAAEIVIGPEILTAVENAGSGTATTISVTAESKTIWGGVRREGSVLGSGIHSWCAAVI